MNFSEMNPFLGSLEKEKLGKRVESHIKVTDQILFLSRSLNVVCYEGKIKSFAEKSSKYTTSFLWIEIEWILRIFGEKKFNRTSGRVFNSHQYIHKWLNSVRFIHRNVMKQNDAIQTKYCPNIFDFQKCGIFVVECWRWPN